MNTTTYQGPTIIYARPGERPTAEQRLYIPYGHSKDVMECRDPVIGLDGPAGTGKSKTHLEKLYACACKYPGSRMCIVRKTRRSITQSAMVTFVNRVLPVKNAVKFHTTYQEFRIPNGSIIAVGGLDKDSKVMSQEWDMIYANELTELFQSDYEALISRLRYGNMPYQQLLFDCNPGPPSHWVKQLADRGDIKMWPSRHQDNPVLWDFKAGTWTEQGAAYIAKLDKLTGVRKARLRYGQWAAAEGMVYDNFDRDVNVIDRFPIPSEWRKWRVVDFGYEHPFVCQWWAEDPDGRLYLYRELYGVHRLVEDWARKIKTYSRYDGGYAGLITDHDAEDRATLEKYLNEDTIPANKTVSVGIQAVQSRLRKQADGKPRLFFFVDALVERSEELDDNELPVSTLTEIEGYIWERGPDGKPRRGERPVKDNDHGMDAMRYMVMHLDDGLPEIDNEIRRAIDAFYS